MTADDFRRLALALPGTTESAHMHHPDFRAGKAIFATLGYPDDHWGMVNLTPEDQHEAITLSPDIFEPSKGAWGRKGSTLVRLAPAGEDLVGRFLHLAWQKSTAKKPVKRR